MTPRARRAPALVGALVIVALAAAAFGVSAQRGTSSSRGGARPAPSASADRAAPADPVREAYARAIAPGLADSTRVRLASFLARYGRHPLARDAHHELGLLAYARGDYARAREEFRRARGPGAEEETRYWEALSLFALGRTREARSLVLPLARARRETPRRWDAASLVALSWAQEGRRAEAFAAYEELFALDGPGGAEAAALYQGVRLARELGRDEDAARWRTRLLRGAPGSPEAASLHAEEKGAPAAADSATARRGTPAR